MMEFIKKTVRIEYKKGGLWKGLFNCSYCGSEKEILILNAKKVHSCGCKSKEIYYRTRMESSEKSKSVIDFGEYIKFSLTNGGYCIIDKSCYDLVKGNSWYKSIRGYVETRKDKKLIKIHRLIMGATEGNIVDHINRDRLDNRKSNLRFASFAQNIHNSGPKTGKYKGVYFNKKTGKYIARCKGLHIGSFLIEEDAAKAYNQVAKKEFGEFAFINMI